MFIGFASLDAYAQSDRKYNKTMEKVYKEKTKELKKDKWSVAGTSLTLDAALMKHLRALNADDKNHEIVAEVSMCKSANVCKANALNNALIEYAQNAGSYVRGRVLSDMFNNASAEVPEEFDKLHAAFERLVQAEIKGELQYSFSVEKPAGEGKSYRSYYIVNEDRASKARLRAMQRAAEETKLAQQYAAQVSNFVQEGFEQ
jgi:serine/threonine-protein kinase RIO1